MSSSLHSIYPLEKVGKFINQIRGISYSAGEASDIAFDKAIPILRANNIDEKINLNKIIFVSEKLVRTNQLIKKGDILIAASSGSKSVVGKAIQIDHDMQYSFGAFCKLIRPKNNINAKYLGYYFMSPYYRHKISNLSAGANINNIRNEHIDTLLIPLPPIETQRKIVEALGKAQELIDKRKEQIALLDDFIQSVFIDMFGDPVNSYSKLPRIKLGDLGRWQSGGTPSRSIPEYYNGTIPWLTSGELSKIYIEESIEKISDDALRNSSAKKIDIGSLLLGMYDSAALKSSINKVVCSCNQAIAFAKLDEKKVNTIYVYYIVQIGRDYFKRLQRGVRQQNLNLSMIKAIEIIYPPLDLQNQFAQIVEKTEEQRELLEKSLTEMENNFNSIMQRAFRGELF